MPPQPRRYSKLGRHPAMPPPVASPEEGSSSPSRAHTRAHADARTDASVGASADASAPAPADAHPGAPAGVSAPGRSDTQLPPIAAGGDSAAARQQWQQQKMARDAGYAWVAAVRRHTQRAAAWAAAMADARRAGVPPAVLRTLIEEAAHRAQVPLEAVPAQVWHAAGLADDR